MTRTLDKVISLLPRGKEPQLPAPRYLGYLGGPPPVNIGLAVNSTENYTSDEGSQLFDGLEQAGYELFGKGHGEQGGTFPDVHDSTRVSFILNLRNPSTVVIQDQVEWVDTPAAQFAGVESLKEREGVFKVLVRKDAHSYVHQSAQIAKSIGAHAWVVYYSPRVVCHLTGFIRPQHVIRIWHTVDRNAIPEYTSDDRHGCLLSGATGRAYPFRNWLFEHARELPSVNTLGHPGYRSGKCHTPQYLQILSQHKVAICTSSIYGYALRKIIEATAAGCVVVTDLPEDEVLPEIDDNLVRIDPGPHIDPNVPQYRVEGHTVTVKDMTELLDRLYAEYDPERQRRFAERAKARYDWRAEGARLAASIEEMRRTYAQGS